MIKKKSYEQMISDSMAYLQNHSPISLVAPGSTSRTLVESALNEVFTAYNTADVALKMAFISTATGYFLDLLGEIVGIFRKQDQFAYVRETDRNVRFYVTSGVLGDYIPKSGDPTKCAVPTGTTITTADGNIVYVTDVDHEAPAQATEIWVTARAQDFGNSSNVGAGGLTSHSLNSSVKVENTSAITTGASLEPDDALRYRIQNAVLSAQGANETAVMQAALAVPGVADVIINEFSAGSGSFDLLLIPEGNRVPLDSIFRVRSAVENTAAFGINFGVREPRYVPIAFDIEIVTPRATDVEKPLIRDIAASRIAQYVGDLRPSSSLEIGRVREAILGASRLVSDLHVRSMRVGGRPQLVADYYLAKDEIFIPDPEETQPFKVI